MPPTPYAGIPFTRVDHPLLTLDTAGLAARRVVIDLARVLYQVCAGDPSPAAARTLRRMRHPRVGDLVVETRVLQGGGEAEQAGGFGLLIADRQETEPDEDGERTVRALYIQYHQGADGVQRWTDGEFLAVPLGFDPAADRGGPDVVGEPAPFLGLRPPPGVQAIRGAVRVRPRGVMLSALPWGGTPEEVERMRMFTAGRFRPYRTVDGRIIGEIQGRDGDGSTMVHPGTVVIRKLGGGFDVVPERTFRTGYEVVERLGGG